MRLLATILDIVIDNTNSTLLSSTLLAYPIMQLITSALVLSTVAVQNAIGAPSNGYPQPPQDLDSFIKAESKIALDGVLCNIGADGCHAAGVPAGVVIAGRDHESPDCTL